MAETTVEFFYDIASPYSYLGAIRVDELEERFDDITVQWKPFFLGGVFKATGNSMPAKLPAKGAYMSEDLALQTERFGAPFSFPDAFPILTVGVLRALIDVERRKGASAAKRLAKACYRAYWGEGEDVSDACVFASVVERAGFDAEQLRAASQQPENKEALKVLTAEAVERGAFGAPTFFVGEQMFWGSDRMETVAWYLREKVGAS